MSSFVFQLSQDGVVKLAQYCMDIIAGKVTIDYLADDSLVGKRWACQYLPQCLCRLPGNQEAQLRILEFLFLHGFFSQIGTQAGLTHCEETSRLESSARVQQLMRQTYHKALGRVAVAGSAERTKSKKHFIEVLYHLAQYAQKLVASPAVKACTEWDKSIKHSWSQALQFIDKIRNSEQSKSSDAFQLLILHLALHLFEDPSSTIDSLADVQVCYIKAHKEETTPRKKKRKVNPEEEGEEPAWMEVLTELLLSLLAQESHFLRMIVSSVFRMLNDCLTPGTLSLLIKVSKERLIMNFL